MFDVPAFAPPRLCVSKSVFIHVYPWLNSVAPNRPSRNDSGARRPVSSVASISHLLATLLHKLANEAVFYKFA
jgi:hypothetical protein